jgi:hypothetical protein
MKGVKKVIYWHRFGQKVYDVPANASPILEKEITSGEITATEEGLSYLNGQSVLLLLSDAISYLYEKVIDPPLSVDEGFRGKLQELIKADIPEDFSEFTWDYKVDNDFDGKQKVIVFAPIKEFQTTINDISKKLMIKILAMETESVAATRDPNPILGILKKPDIKGDDDEVLNLSTEPDEGNKKISIKTIGLIFLGVLLLIGGIFGAIKLILNVTGSEKKAPVVTILVPTIAPTEISPTMAAIKEWSELSVMVQNGTSQSGLASKKANILKEGGITNVESGNADNKDYVSNVLIFKEEILKENYLKQFTDLITVSEKDIKVDNSIGYDVVFILGLN